MSETTPLIKAALNLRGGAGFDVYKLSSFVHGLFAVLVKMGYFLIYLYCCMVHLRIYFALLWECTLTIKCPELKSHLIHYYMGI